MKILFAIQGTGNGHISRAREVLPHLLQYGAVDVLISGHQAEVHLPYIIKYKHKGIGYTFGKKGGIDIIDSIKRFRPFQFFKDIYSFPIEQYDVVINDFEPVTAWACKIKGKTAVSLSHQAAYLSLNTPRPEKRDPIAEKVFKYYAPTTLKKGFHFKSYDSFIYTPIIRADIRKLNPSDGEHITVYLPAHADELLLRILGSIPDMKWEVFSKHTTQAYRVSNVFIKPINSDHFSASLATGNGLVTAGGFESPAEAIYLGKKVLSVPMHNQYEQLCNAVAMKDIGVTVVKKIDENFGHKLKTWLEFGSAPSIHYPDQTAAIIEDAIMEQQQLPTFAQAIQA
jgi:uncharacterized protein (TIGR00661 family)